MKTKVEEIFKDMLVMIMTNFCDENGEPGNMAMDIWEENEKDFNIFIDQICQLIPEEGVVIAEGMVELIIEGEQLVGVFLNCGKKKIWLNNLLLEKQAFDYQDKKVKIILEEE